MHSDLDFGSHRVKCEQNSLHISEGECASEVQIGTALLLFCISRSKTRNLSENPATQCALDEICPRILASLTLNPKKFGPSYPKLRLGRQSRTKNKN